MTEYELEKELEKIQTRDAKLWVVKLKLQNAHKLRREFTEKAQALAAAEATLQQYLSETE